MASYEDQVIIKFSADLRELLSGITQARDALKDMTQASQANATANTQLSTSMTSAASSSRGMTTNLRQANTTAMDSVSSFKELDNQTGKFSTSFRKIALSLTTGSNELDKLSIMFDRASMQMWKFTMAAMPLREIGLMLGGLGAGLGFGLKKIIEAGDLIDRVNRQFLAIYESERIATDVSAYLVEQAKHIRYTMDEVLEAGRLLAVEGFDPKELIMPMADLAAGVGQEGLTIVHATRAFVDATNGHFKRLKETFQVTADDVRRIAPDAFFPTGAIKDKALATEAIIAAINRKYVGMNEATVQTISGQMSMMNDAIIQTMASMSEAVNPMVMDIMKNIEIKVKKINEFAKTDFGQITTRTAAYATGLTILAGGASFAASGIVTLLGVLASYRTFVATMTPGAQGGLADIIKGELELMAVTREIGQVEADRAMKSLPMLRKRLELTRELRTAEEARMNIAKAELMVDADKVDRSYVSEQQEILSSAKARAAALEAELTTPQMHQQFQELSEIISGVRGQLEELKTMYPDIEMTGSEAPVQAKAAFNELNEQLSSARASARDLRDQLDIKSRIDISGVVDAKGAIQESKASIQSAREEIDALNRAFAEVETGTQRGGIQDAIARQREIIQVEEQRIILLKEMSESEDVAVRNARTAYGTIKQSLIDLYRQQEENIEKFKEMSSMEFVGFREGPMRETLERGMSSEGKMHIVQEQLTSRLPDFMEKEKEYAQKISEFNEILVEIQNKRNDVDNELENARARIKDAVNAFSGPLSDAQKSGLRDIIKEGEKVLYPLEEQLEEIIEAQKFYQEQVKSLRDEIDKNFVAPIQGVGTSSGLFQPPSREEMHRLISPEGDLTQRIGDAAREGLRDTAKEMDVLRAAVSNYYEQHINKEKEIREEYDRTQEEIKERMQLHKGMLEHYEKQIPKQPGALSEFGAGFAGGISNVFSPIMTLVSGPLRMVVDGAISSFRNVQRALAEGGPKMAGAITGNIVALGALAAAAIYTAWAENQKRKQLEAFSASVKSATEKMDAWANSLAVNEFEDSVIRSQKDTMNIIRTMSREADSFFNTIDVARIALEGEQHGREGVRLDRVLSESADLSEEQADAFIKKLSEFINKKMQEGELRGTLQKSAAVGVLTFGAASRERLGLDPSHPAYEAFQKFLKDGELPVEDMSRIQFDKKLIDEFLKNISDAEDLLGGVFSAREKVAIEATENYIAAQKANWDNLSEYEREVVTAIEKDPIPYQRLRIHLDDAAKSLQSQVDEVKNVESSMNEALRTGEDFSKVYEEHLQKYQKAVEANRKLNELLETRTAINAKEEDSLRAQARERERALKIAEKDLEVAVAKRNLEMAGKWAEYAGAGGASEAFLFGPEMEENYRKIGEHGKAMKAVADNIKDTAALARDLQQVSEYASPQQKAQSSANLARIAREEARRMKEEVFDPQINEMERQGMTEEADKIRLVARARLSSLERDAQKHQVDASRTLLESDLDRMEVQRRMAAVGTKHEHELYNYDVAILAKKEEIARITNNQNELMNIQAEKAELIKRTEESIEQAKRNQLSETEALYSSQLQYLEALNSTGFLGDEVIEQAKGRMYNFFVWMAGQFNYGTAEWYQNMTKALGFLEQETEDGYDGMISKILGAPSELVESVISEGSLARRFSQMAGSLGDIRGDILSSSGNEIVVRIKADLPLHQIESRVNEALPGVMENLGRDLIAAMG